MYNKIYKTILYICCIKKILNCDINIQNIDKIYTIPKSKPESL